MRWTAESHSELVARKRAKHREQWLREREWHRWFAWRPVGIGTEWELDAKEKAWLVTVERRLANGDRENQPEFYRWDLRRFQYRLPETASDRP